MPPFGGIIKTSDDLWKIIAWMRSVNPGSEKQAAAAIDAGASSACMKFW